MFCETKSKTCDLCFLRFRMSDSLGSKTCDMCFLQFRISRFIGYPPSDLLFELNARDFELLKSCLMVFYSSLSLIHFWSFFVVFFCGLWGSDQIQPRFRPKCRPNSDQNSDQIQTVLTSKSPMNMGVLPFSIETPFSLKCPRCLPDLQYESAGLPDQETYRETWRKLLAVELVQVFRAPGLQNEVGTKVYELWIFLIANVQKSAGSIHHVMWSFRPKLAAKRQTLSNWITWCPWTFKTSAFGITWCYNFWSILRLEVAERC